jgi:hypothetical protein
MHGRIYIPSGDRIYNEIMARGWESKSVESQMESAASERQPRKVPLTPSQIEILRKRESLQLSRTHVLHELDACRNPRYREILRRALADLETALAKLA